MIKDILIEYADMREEIKDLRRRIDEDKKKIDRLSETIVSDTVTCGKKGKKPLQTVTIRGIPSADIGRRKLLLQSHVRKLEALEIDLLELTNQAEEYIEKIEKSELRTMFRLYYIDDLTWYQVAMRMNGMFPGRRIAYTDDNCKQRHKRYLDSLENVTLCHGKS